MDVLDQCELSALNNPGTSLPLGSCGTKVDVFFLTFRSPVF